MLLSTLQVAKENDMVNNPENKYRLYKAVNLKDREWPNRVHSSAPIWCSTDMRDGNQALIEPLDEEKKSRFFKLLVDVGFKHIEVGFPAASKTDYNYIRGLIEHNRIPKDVTIQVMTQARTPLIEKTFEALKGVPRAIIHLYNATSPFFREVVFNTDRSGCIKIATNAVNDIKRFMALNNETKWTLQYSPETFCFTEPDFGLEICNAVIDEYQPTHKNKLILNLPTTVEVSTPNVFADHVEWFCRHIKAKENIIISVHPHNDRGTGVATAELACLAGAERIEGTLLGNGERTGNLDIINLALNLYVSGINPKLNLSNISSIIKEVSYLNNLPVHPRHPYVGELVFTAFSGSHQDAIKKGFNARKNKPNERWEIPYLLIDPRDIGLNYESIVRVNSQSGKGGVSYLLEKNNIFLPRVLQIEFSQIIQEQVEKTGLEISKEAILSCFNEEFFSAAFPFKLVSLKCLCPDSNEIEVNIQTPQGLNLSFKSPENKIMPRFFNSICPNRITLLDKKEAILKEERSTYSYVKIQIEDNIIFGIGRNENRRKAYIEGVICAFNRAIKKGYVNL